MNIYMPFNFCSVLYPSLSLPSLTGNGLLVFLIHWELSVQSFQDKFRNAPNKMDNHFLPSFAAYISRRMVNNFSVIASNPKEVQLICYFILMMVKEV